MHVGLAVRSPEAVQGMMFIFVFPLTFASSAFVPTDTMPNWLADLHRASADHTRDQHGPRLDARCPAGGDAWAALFWSVGILVVFFPLALIMYRKRTTD